MDEVEVSEDALLPEVQGLKGPFGCLNRARATGSPGERWAPPRRLHAARQYTLDRAQFGQAAGAQPPAQSSCSSPTCKTEIALGLQAALRAGCWTKAR